MRQFRHNRGVLIAIVLFTFLAVVISCNTCEERPEDFDVTISIPTEGNSWVINGKETANNIVKKGGIKNWADSENIIRTYFKTTKQGKLNVALVVNANSGSAKIEVTCAAQTKILEIGKGTSDTVFAGSFIIDNAGYNHIDIKGIEKSGSYYPDIPYLLIGGEAAGEKVWFVHDDFYWGRRGPSVHLSYQIPGNTGDILYYYNEITVPENNDVLGSYFMADGFAQGYFGMQVNSATERHILFSVWSPYKTNNPNEIPKDQRIKLLKKGEGVHTGEFGNEGSGGQSYYNYMWKAGNTYKFLLKGEPTGNGETDFTAWFFAPEVNKWKLIASFRRPKTDTYLTRFHSFLENFHTETGNITRMGIYSNQWVYTTGKQWIKITRAKFTADATARKEARMDYAGGTQNNSFYLKNCGFFNETTKVDSEFEVPNNNSTAPDIDFEKLQ